MEVTLRLVKSVLSTKKQLPLQGLSDAECGADQADGKLPDRNEEYRNSLVALLALFLTFALSALSTNLFVILLQGSKILTSL